MHLKENIEAHELIKRGYQLAFDYIDNYYIKKVENAEIRIFGTVAIEVLTPRACLKSPKLIKKYIKDLIDAGLTEE